MNEHKVIGYFSHFGGINVLCDADGCIIAGSKEKMTEYINASRVKGREVLIKMTRYGIFKNALLIGAAYELDHEAYIRFKHAADTDGLVFFEHRYIHKESKAALTRVVLARSMQHAAVMQCDECGCWFYAPDI